MEPKNTSLPNQLRKTASATAKYSALVDAASSHQTIRTAATMSALPVIRVRIDDTLDVFAVHGVGGIFGTIMIAVLGAGSWAAQLGSLVIVGLFTVAVSYALIRIAAAISPIRVDLESETNGLDLSQHGERAYELTS